MRNATMASVPVVEARQIADSRMFESRSHLCTQYEGQECLHLKLDLNSAHVRISIGRVDGHRPKRMRWYFNVTLLIYIMQLPTSDEIF